MKLPQNVELDDLYSAGIFGLMDAVDGYDLERGVKFETYCTTRIRGSILDALGTLAEIKAKALERRVAEILDAGESASVIGRDRVVSILCKLTSARHSKTALSALIAILKKSPGQLIARIGPTTTD